jgi:hypothetical protein
VSNKQSFDYILTIDDECTSSELTLVEGSVTSYTGPYIIFNDRDTVFNLAYWNEVSERKTCGAIQYEI